MYSLCRVIVYSQKVQHTEEALISSDLRDLPHAEDASANADHLAINAQRDQRESLGQPMPTDADWSTIILKLSTITMMFNVFAVEVLSSVLRCPTPEQNAEMQRHLSRSDPQSWSQLSMPYSLYICNSNYIMYNIWFIAFYKCICIYTFIIPMPLIYIYIERERVYIRMWLHVYIYICVQCILYIYISYIYIYILYIYIHILYIYMGMGQNPRSPVDMRQPSVQ